MLIAFTLVMHLMLLMYSLAADRLYNGVVGEGGKGSGAQ